MKARVAVTLFDDDGRVIGSSADHVEIGRGRVGWRHGASEVSLVAVEAMSRAGAPLFPMDADETRVRRCDELVRHGMHGWVDDEGPAICPGCDPDEKASIPGIHEATG